MRTGKLTEQDWSKIGKAIGRLEAPLFIDDNPNVTVMEIRAKARRMKARHGSLGLVVVDYLQLMSGRASAENRQVEVSEISRGLKILARELEVPIVALSQLSRNLEARADKKPMLADLRESGCLVGSTRLTRSDTNEEVTLAELVQIWRHGRAGVDARRALPPGGRHVAAGVSQRRQGDVRAAALIGPGRRGVREPPVPHRRRLAPPGRAEHR